MTTYYLDSSALSKRYVEEVGSEWIRALTSRDTKHLFLTARILERYPLRAYDAVQLASSLIANRALLANNLPPLTSVSADERLNAAAATEDLAVENPNEHQ